MTTYADAASEIKNDIFKCRTYHNTNVVAGNTNVDVADKYCASVMSPVIFCAEQKLIKAISDGGLSSAAIPQLRNKYKIECASSGTASVSAAGATAQSAQSAQLTQAQQAQAAQLAQQQQAAAAQAAARQNQQNAAQPSQQNLQVNSQLLNSLAPTVDRAVANYNSARATAKLGKAAPAVPAVAAPPAASQPSLNSNSPNNENKPASIISESNSNNNDSSDPAQNEIKINRLTDVNKKFQNEVDAKLGKLQKDLPNLSRAGEKVREDGKKADEVKPKSEITVASEEASEKLTTEVSKSITTIVGILKTNIVASKHLFPEATNALDVAIKDVINYTTKAKLSCTSVTEKTEFLCVEGKSPGAVAVKGLMEVAGPVLGSIQSVQKACSDTATVTDFASKALMLARGVCVVSQLACKATCGTALNKMIKGVEAAHKTALEAASKENTVARLECTFIEMKANNPLTAPPVKPMLIAKANTCYQEAFNKYTAVIKAADEIKAAVALEKAPTTAGTAAGLAAKCHLKEADIAGMASNITNLVMAKKSADECDKKMSASGVAGGGVSPTTYCETPENVSTQFCKCKVNNQQEGCPGYTADRSAIEKEREAAQRGLQLLNGNGVSGFASSGSGGGSDVGGSGLDSLKESASTQETSEKLSLSDTGSTTTSAGSFGGGANVNGSGGTVASDGSDKPEEEKKKLWSFGSFASSLGGMFSSNSSSVKGKSGNGDASAKASAIERKIASDKLAAEITSASGKSNWEKVRQIYLIKENTLLSGQ